MVSVGERERVREKPVECLCAVGMRRKSNNGRSRRRFVEEVVCSCI